MEWREYDILKTLKNINIKSIFFCVWLYFLKITQNHKKWFVAQRPERKTNNALIFIIIFKSFFFNNINT